MNLIDMRTVILSYVISNTICVTVIASLWSHNRRRFAGLGFWLADFLMQFTALLLIILRGLIPDLLSIVISNALIIGGTMLLYVGLEHFVGKRGPQIHNIVLFAVFLSVQIYFAVIHPSLDARNINVSLGLLAICFQCARLMLQRVDAEMRPITNNIGVIFTAYCLISVARIFVDLVVPSSNDLFHSNAFDTLVVMVYQMFFIALTFALFLMVNRRLFADLERDIAEHNQASEALKLSEEKFFKAFHASPDAYLISRLSDGKLVEVNEGFTRLTGYSQEEALASSAIYLGLWHNSQDREFLINTLSKNHSVRDHEYEFRVKSGEMLNCLYSGEIIQLGGEAHILSVVHNITDRKQTEEAVNRGRKFLASTLDALPIGVCLTDETGHYRMMNKTYCAIYEYDLEEMIGQHYSVIMPPDQVELANIHYARLLSGDIGIPTERKRQRKDGSIIYIEAANALVENVDGMKMVITTVREITERKQAEEEKQKAHDFLQAQFDQIQALQVALREQAIRDPLTGLYNRRNLTETIDRELARAKREGYPVSFVIIDVDHFKKVNDTLGHDIGDMVLQSLATQLTEQTRAGDIIFRYGGEEFLLALPNTSTEAAFQSAERLRSTFQTSMLSAHKEIHPTLSLGIATFPFHAATSKELLVAADQAMYIAKARGRNCVIIWQPNESA